MSCSTCKGTCPHPQACGLPERTRTFEPDYGIQGPARRRPATSRTAVRVLTYTALATTVGLALARFLGWL